MKNKIIVGSIFLLSLISCNQDFLEIPVEDKTSSSNFFKSSEDAVQATNQIYSNLRSWNLAAFAPLGVLNITSDDADKGSSPADASFMDELNFFTYNATHGQIGGYWSGQFSGINLCNQVIENVPNVSMDATLKTRLIAEARFLRAYHYFNLVKAFGGVPIFDGFPEDGNFNIPRNTKEEVYTFIQSEFLDASQNLPETYPSTESGRATKGAALAFLAKTYLYQSNWAKVKETTDQVMALGYDLYPDYYQLFRIANENCVESIFEIQCTGDLDAGWWDSQYGEVQGVRGQFGWGFGIPSESLIAAYETGDLRKNATVLFRGTTTPEGDFINADGDNPYYNNKVYVPNSQQPSVGAWNAPQNIRVMRYAEVLLMNAEANNELGNVLVAAVSINKLRTRAGLANTLALTQAGMRAAIRNERRVELALEWDRFLDLVRSGQAPTVLGSLGFTAGKNELFPIPQDEITLSKGVLTQNPGY
ncbi:RagB/SusD family nutrient uptake outer membrane protein [Flavobacterium sp. XS2P39]|uniref:RagB/SusD family nutrient uptake outer membrane protein n=1 Tax=Flavobacterium sp. XS2P39 TaxID=3401725 RepID=UPI003AAC4451